MVWMDEHTLGWAQMAVLVLIHLKDPSWFPHQKQYPLRLDVKKGLIPIIKDLKRQELLQPIQYSYSWCQDRT
jgi:hypothetical protein